MSEDRKKQQVDLSFLVSEPEAAEMCDYFRGLTRSGLHLLLRNQAKAGRIVAVVGPKGRIRGYLRSSVEKWIEEESGPGGYMERNRWRPRYRKSKRGRFVVPGSIADDGISTG